MSLVKEHRWPCLAEETGFILTIRTLLARCDSVVVWLRRLTYGWITEARFVLRRCVAILLLLGFIANQLAVFPHAHSECPDPHRPAAPHVHLAGGHWHEHELSRHEHPHGEAAHPPNAIAAALHGPSTRHDADAFYPPIGTGSLLTAKRQASGVAGQPTCAALHADAARLPTDSRGLAAIFHPPDGPSVGGKLYLTLRTLRI
jgi:hypothetical protein